MTDPISPTQRLSAEYSQPLGGRTTGALRLDVSRNVSLPDPSATATPIVWTYRTSLGLSRELFWWLVGRLDYFYYVQESQGVALEADRHAVTIGITAQPRRSRIF